MPGYRRALTLGLSPYVPPVGALPGGVTPAFGAPTPASNWSFKWNGFLNASLQMSINRRPDPTDGQTRTVLHVPPQTLDEYASFVGTATMPGTWAALNFEYGNKVVAVNFSLNTWNPSAPSTYYQIGSQYFVNNAFVTAKAPPIGGVSLRMNFGYFYNYYGSLSQYGLGIYTNSVIGNARGVGGTVLAEYPINSSLSLLLEDGIMGNRNGHAPSGALNPLSGTSLDPAPVGVVPSSGNGMNNNPIFPFALIHHLHLGLIRKGDPTFRAQLHYMVNWAADDRTQMATDNPVTRWINEAQPHDGRITVMGGDASLNSPLWGFLGVAASYTKGDNAGPLRGLTTFGGEGAQLTDRWWGLATAGTGTMAVAGINYSVSLGKIVAHPTPFNGDGPDLIINTGFIIAKVTPGQGPPSPLPVPFEPFDRVRHKYGLDVLYKLLPWLSAGIRGDRVVPTSRDDGETFHVLAPRLVFKTDWQSREAVSLMYAKWFYGPRSHPEASSSTEASGKIDDQLIALNVNMWW